MGGPSTPDRSGAGAAQGVGFGAAAAGPVLPFGNVHYLSAPLSFFLGLLALAFVFAMDFFTNDLRSLPFVRDRLPIAASELARNHNRLTVIAWLLILVGLVAAALFLLWQYMTHANVRTLRPEALRLGPGAAVALWFIPLANLVLPFLAIRALWRASDPDVDLEEPRSPRITPLFWLWWLAWLTGIGLALAAYLPALGGELTAEQLIVRDRIAIAACGAGVVTAILAVVIVQMERGRLILLEDRVRYPHWRGWTTSRTRPA